MSGAEVAGLAAEHERPRVTEVEQHGIDTIPPEHRHSGPFDLFRIQFGGANTFATVILGTFPILLGLSLWQAVAATVRRRPRGRADPDADGAVRPADRHQQRGRPRARTSACAAGSSARSCRC